MRIKKYSILLVHPSNWLERLIFRKYKDMVVVWPVSSPTYRDTYCILRRTIFSGWIVGPEINEFNRTEKYDVLNIKYTLSPDQSSHRFKKLLGSSRRKIEGLMFLFDIKGSETLENLKQHGIKD